MELTPKQQTTELIRQANRLLLVARPDADGDALGSLIGLGLALKKMSKEVTMVSPEPISPMLSFLPALSEVKQDFVGTRDLQISLNLQDVEPDKVSYRRLPTENKLEILVTPKSGVIPLEAVQLTHTGYHFDLVVILDTPDLEQLGETYNTHTQLFFETPVINIDHHAGNDYFGKVNWVELTATSTCEILVSLIESLAGQAPVWDEDIATALLAGIISDTRSFQSETTTPKSLTVAAQLIAQGGRQQEVVRSLFKTRPLATLKIWGAILSTLVVEDEARLVWGQLTKNDLATAGGQASEIGVLMDELVKNAPGADLAVIFVEEGPARTSVLIQALQKNLNLLDFARQFGGGGTAHRTLLSLNSPLAEAQEKVLAALRQLQLSVRAN